MYDSWLSDCSPSSRGMLFRNLLNKLVEHVSVLLVKFDYLRKFGNDYCVLCYAYKGHVYWLLTRLSTKFLLLNDNCLHAYSHSANFLVAMDLYCLFLSQESGANYKLLLKKVKAHERDVNSVQWSPKVTPHILHGLVLESSGGPT